MHQILFSMSLNITSPKNLRFLALFLFYHNYIYLNPTTAAITNASLQMAIQKSGRVYPKVALFVQKKKLKRK